MLYCFTIIIFQLIIVHSHKNIHYLVAMHFILNISCFFLSLASKTNALGDQIKILNFCPQGLQNAKEKAEKYKHTLHHMNDEWLS